MDLDFKILENVDDYDLNILYNTCWAYVQLSIYEGFGIPLIEASRCAAACILRDLEYSREVLGKIGYYIDGEINNNLQNLKKLEKSISVDNSNNTIIQSRVNKSFSYTKENWDADITKIHFN